MPRDLYRTAGRSIFDIRHRKWDANNVCTAAFKIIFCHLRIVDSDQIEKEGVVTKPGDGFRLRRRQTPEFGARTAAGSLEAVF